MSRATASGPLVLVRPKSNSVRTGRRFTTGRILPDAGISGERTFRRVGNLRETIALIRITGIEAMTSKNLKKSNFGRRDFLQLAGAGLAAASAGTAALQASASTQPAGLGNLPRASSASRRNSRRT